MTIKQPKSNPRKSPDYLTYFSHLSTEFQDGKISGTYTISPIKS
jgi:hypothetical protein